MKFDKKLDTNTVYRYNSQFDPEKKLQKGAKGSENKEFYNLLYFTCTPNKTKPLLERGINPIVDKIDDGRIPAILININPYKSGTSTTPWMDIIDADNGYIKYFGDNKASSKTYKNPNTSMNKRMIEQYKLHSSNKFEDRVKSAPIIIFKQEKVSNNPKGYKKFIGFGIITKVELIIEYDSKCKVNFPNFAFDITILNMEKENETFDWNWINLRRNKTISINKSHEIAPNSWKEWSKSGGNNNAHKLRRVIYKKLIINKDNQIVVDKNQITILKEICNHYKKNKNEEDFEGLAAFVTEQVIAENGIQYKFGWLSDYGADGGIDYVGKITLGKGIVDSNIIILGQAKCIEVTKNNKFTGGNPISGLHLARTVARLKRGWMGVFVTTSTFSKRAQEEMHDDKFPLLLINGMKLSEVIIKHMHKTGENDIFNFLKKIDTFYKDKRKKIKPEQILYYN